ncbi:MAG: hypothetical protein K8T10_07250 [Candidatus Eremiobacteraeota bacterium]|nr:hypothetical protein [Candidatus Eremiobacteraeota bacterium]
MKRKTVIIIFLLLLSVTIAVILSSCKETDNPVFLYLKNVELQYEGEVQKENIKTALQDILTLTLDQLKKKRYRDYKGKENQWDLPTLIEKHFVPAKSGITLGDNFYKDVKSMEVQNEVKIILDRLVK